MAVFIESNKFIAMHIGSALSIIYINECVYVCAECHFVLFFACALYTHTYFLLLSLSHSHLNVFFQLACEQAIFHRGFVC